ncbi:hypothetical protein GCM10027341_53660 [Spirosoma knui]
MLPTYLVIAISIMHRKFSTNPQYAFQVHVDNGNSFSYEIIMEYDPIGYKKYIRIHFAVSYM